MNVLNIIQAELEKRKVQRTADIHLILEVTSPAERDYNIYKKHRIQMVVLRKLNAL